MTIEIYHIIDRYLTFAYYMSHQYDYQCETQSQEECDEQRHYEYEEMLKLIAEEKAIQEIN